MRRAKAPRLDLSLLCPGLFGPLDLSPGHLVSTPVLDRLLARAEGGTTEPRDPLETLAAAFGVSPSAGGDLPSAPLCLVGEGLPPDPSECWYHADPVHLRPDRDRLLLFAGPDLAIHPEESEALVAAFNRHFGGDGLHLVATHPDLWYLRTDRPPALRTRPLHAVLGRALDAGMPTGPNAGPWTRWQTEAQMLFFGHPVNRERERLGRPTLGGLWTWGGGQLPRVTAGPALTFADHPLAVGLARSAGQVLRGLDALESGDPLAGAPAGSEEMLVFWDRLWWPALSGDEGAWISELERLEELAAALLAGLAAGRLGLLRIDDGSSYRFTLTRKGLRRFWRRRGGLAARLVRDPRA